LECWIHTEKDEYLIDKGNPEGFTVCKIWLRKRTNWEYYIKKLIQKDGTEQKGERLTIYIQNSMQYVIVTLRERKIAKL